MTDGFSRYLLGCQALSSTAVAGAKPVFTRLFQEYGLPKRIRTDNGVPFATTTLARLSTAVGLVGAPGHPAGVHRARASRSRTAGMSACTAP